ncbi:unnamed protein product [Caenorhabditis nigoni]
MIEPPAELKPFIEEESKDQLEKKTKQKSIEIVLSNTDERRWMLAQLFESMNIVFYSLLVAVVPEQNPLFSIILFVWGMSIFHTLVTSSVIFRDFHGIQGMFLLFQAVFKIGCLLTLPHLVTTIIKPFDSCRNHIDICVNGTADIVFEVKLVINVLMQIIMLMSVLVEILRIFIHSKYTATSARREVHPATETDLDIIIRLIKEKEMAERVLVAKF